MPGPLLRTVDKMRHSARPLLIFLALGTLLAWKGAPAAPRPLVAYVIVNGSARGLQLFGNPGVALAKNRDLEAKGTVTRAPGDALPLFTGLISGSPSTQLPVVELKVL